MSYKVADTPEGRVVRVIESTGEHAYRISWAPNDRGIMSGRLAKCGDHKGPWITVNDWREIPMEVRQLLNGEGVIE